MTRTANDVVEVVMPLQKKRGKSVPGTDIFFLEDLYKIELIEFQLHVTVHSLSGSTSLQQPGRNAELFGRT